MEEEIRRAGQEDEAPFARLKDLMRRYFEGWQADGERTLKIGSARICVAYRGDVCRRYIEEYTRLYWSRDDGRISIRVGICDFFPIGLVREPTLWEEDGRVYLGRWDFFAELERSSRSARAIVSHEAEFFSVDSAVRVALGGFAFPEDCTLLHGMASARGDIGIVGSAPGRGGKSTSARLLRAQGWSTLCDDLPAIYEEDGGLMLSGTPFWSYREKDFDVSSFTSQHVPLRAVFLLEKGSEVSVERCGRAEAAGALLRNVLHYGAAEEIGVAKFRFISRLVEAVPVFRLWFLRDCLPEEIVLKHIEA